MVRKKKKTQEENFDWSAIEQPQNESEVLMMNTDGSFAAANPIAESTSTSIDPPKNNSPYINGRLNTELLKTKMSREEFDETFQNLSISKNWEAYKYNGWFITGDDKGNIIVHNPTTWDMQYYILPSLKDISQNTVKEFMALTAQSNRMDIFNDMLQLIYISKTPITDFTKTMSLFAFVNEIHNDARFTELTPQSIELPIGYTPEQENDLNVLKIYNKSLIDSEGHSFSEDEIAQMYLKENKSLIEFLDKFNNTTNPNSIKCVVYKSLPELIFNFFDGTNEEKIPIVQNICDNLYSLLVNNNCKPLTLN